MTEQPIDTSAAVGKAFRDMLGVFAEFETYRLAVNWGAVLPCVEIATGQNCLLKGSPESGLR
nr:hypothetical protein [Rhizobium sp. SL86]